MKKARFYYIGLFLAAMMLGACSQSDDLTLRNESSKVSNYEAIYRYYAALHPQRTAEEAIRLAANYGQTLGVQTRSASYLNTANWEVQSICNDTKKKNIRVPLHKMTL